MWNFRGSWFLNLKLPKGVNVAKFLGVFSGFSKGKVTNLKILARFFRKVYPQLPPAPCLDFFFNSPIRRGRNKAIIKTKFVQMRARVIECEFQ